MPQHPPRHFNRIRQFRMEKDLTQRDLAHILGLQSASLLSDLENGLKLPTLETAMKLQAGLQRLIDDIYPHVYDQARASVAARRAQFFNRRKENMNKI